MKISVNYKKIIALIVAAVLLLALAACGQGSSQAKDPAASGPSGKPETGSSETTQTGSDEQQPEQPEAWVPAENDEPRYTADGENPFLALEGAYQDEAGMRASMDIYAYGDDAGMVSVSWANSADETVAWTFYCEMSEDGGSFYYSDGMKDILHFDENGEMTDEPVYEDGTGSFVIYNNHIDWIDDKEDAGNGCRFVLIDSGATGGI